MTDPDVLAILRAYPQIYLACHVAHRSRGASRSGLTSRDASLLAHIDEPDGTGPAALARHLGIARSTLSAALSRLAALGMLAIDADPADARRRRIRLLDKGRAAFALDSVLDPDRLTAMLAGVSKADRAAAVAGLCLLAAAARRFREGEG